MTGVFEAIHSSDLLGRYEYAFATAVCSDAMEAGVTVLHEGLVANGHRQPLLVLASISVSREVRTRLATLPLVKMFHAHAGHAQYCAGREVEGMHECSHMKLLLFALGAVKKIVFLEHDTVVLRPLKELAALPPFSGVREAYVGLFETAVMVIKPDAQVYSVLRTEFCQRVSQGLWTSDHEILRTTVPDEAWTEASDTYNVPQEHMDALWHRRVDTTPAVIHYKGGPKPWNWWSLGSGEPMSLDAFNRWCGVAKTTPYACGAPDNDAMIPPMQPSGWSDKKRLTVMLSTYHRPTWQGLLRHYTSFKVVSQVVLVWHDPAGDPPLAAALGLKVVVWQPTKDSLNNRFFGPGNLTECVYVCDDDMKVNEAQLMRGFQIWKGHSRRLVGYFPRRWMMDSPYYSTRVHDGYNVVLTKGLFTHRYFLYMYVHLLPQRVKDVVDKYGNCEDLLFNMMVAGYSGVAPLHILVEGQILDLGHGGGISGRGAHFSTRFQCVQDLVSEMGLTKAPLTIGSYSEKPLKNKERE